MNLLVTSSRMPFALEEIRKLGRSGHAVFAADTFAMAAGSHSRWAAGHAVVAAPSVAPRDFVQDVINIVQTHNIELIVPAFEEVFYLAHARPALPCALFAPRFETLAALHDKSSFQRLADALGFATPPTSVAQSDGELAAAIRRHGRYFARPVWSRGGINLLTNVGPLAGTLDAARCHPTPARPWIVQRAVDGVDVCTFSIVHHGHVIAHCAYGHPRELDYSGGICFESLDGAETLAVVQRLAATTDYHGQLSLDFSRGDGGLVLLECNPRPSAGAHLMPTAMLVGALLRPNHQPLLVPPGVRRMYASALLRDLFKHHEGARIDLAYLLSDARDVYYDAGDRLPALYQLLSYAQVLAYKRRHRSDGERANAIKAAYFDGIVWNGEAIP